MLRLPEGWGRPKADAAASAAASGGEPWGRACLVLPERTRAGATLGPGAGWQRCRSRGAGPAELCTPRRRFGLASGRGHCFVPSYFALWRTAFRPSSPAVPPRAALKNSSLGRHVLASGRRWPASWRTCRRYPGGSSLESPRKSRNEEHGGTLFSSPGSLLLVGPQDSACALQSSRLSFCIP